MPRVVGVDSSTQSTKVVVCDADDGAVLAEASAPHPDATEVDPAAWWDALTQASDGLLDEVDAIAVAGQQHGMVVTDEAGHVVRPALLWNDNRSADAAVDLTQELGGPGAWATAVGSVPLASFTVTKLRWLRDREPEAADRVAACSLPHDWLTARLTTTDTFTTDRGDASGTGYWSPADGRYRHDLIELALGRSIRVPDVVGPAAQVGETTAGQVVAAGTGDNMAAALGLGLGAGDVVVSLGTSGTVFASSSEPTADETGIVAGFADATGRFLPLVCTLNAARVLTAAANLVGVDHQGFDALAAEAPIGAGGLTMLPYLDGERTPPLPTATGSLHGITRSNLSSSHLARAAVEGMLCGLADGLDALVAHGVEARRVILIGGGAASSAVRAAAPGIFGRPIACPAPAQYVALGAARQAAWALKGGSEPPAWPVSLDHAHEPAAEHVAAYLEVRARYAEVRQAAYG